METNLVIKENLENIEEFDNFENEIDDDNFDIEEFMSEDYDTETKVVDGMQVYLREMAKYDLLTQEEELSIFKRIKELRAKIDKIKEQEEEGIQTRDERTKLQTELSNLEDKVHLHNMRLVISVVKKYFPIAKTMTSMDLIMEGNIGMMTAIKKYDPDTGYKFSTYAVWWIRQAALRAINNSDKMIRIPVHVHETSYNINKFIVRFKGDNNRVPTVEEISEETGISEERINDFFNLEKLANITSIDMPIKEDEECYLLNILEDEKSLEYQKVFENEEFEKTVRDMILNCPNIRTESKEKYYDVIARRFGFERRRVETLEEIAITYGVTTERISQIEAKGIRILKSPKNKSILKSYKE